MISDLVDYLNNNLLIAHFCGFDISRPLPSYWTFDRFLKNFDNEILSKIMKSQVLLLNKEGIVDLVFTLHPTRLMRKNMPCGRMVSSPITGVHAKNSAAH